MKFEGSRANVLIPLSPSVTTRQLWFKISGISRLYKLFNANLTSKSLCTIYEFISFFFCDRLGEGLIFYFHMIFCKVFTIQLRFQKYELLMPACLFKSKIYLAIYCRGSSHITSNSIDKNMIHSILVQACICILRAGRTQSKITLWITIFHCV